MFTRLCFKYILIFANRYSTKPILLIEDMALLFKYRCCNDVSFRRCPDNDSIPL